LTHQTQALTTQHGERQPSGQAETSPTDLRQVLDDLERTLLSRTLQNAAFNLSVAAEQLGLSLRQMRYRMTRLRMNSPTQQDAGETHD
jgi:two-component system response regulator PilR (NtrC family)